MIKVTEQAMNHLTGNSSDANEGKIPLGPKGGGCAGSKLFIDEKKKKRRK